MHAIELLRAQLSRIPQLTVSAHRIAPSVSLHEPIPPPSLGECLPNRSSTRTPQQHLSQPLLEHDNISTASPIVDTVKTEPLPLHTLRFTVQIGEHVLLQPWYIVEPHPPDSWGERFEFRVRHDVLDGLNGFRCRWKRRLRVPCPMHKHRSTLASLIAGAEERERWPSVSRDPIVGHPNVTTVFLVIASGIHAPPVHVAMLAQIVPHRRRVFLPPEDCAAAPSDFGLGARYRIVGEV